MIIQKFPVIRFIPFGQSIAFQKISSYNCSLLRILSKYIITTKQRHFHRKNQYFPVLNVSIVTASTIEAELPIRTS